MEHADWWEFRHPQFLRGEPQLLSDIKRSVHFGKMYRDCIDSLGHYFFVSFLCI